MIERFNDEKSKINNFSRILSLNSPMNKVVNSYLEVEKVKEKLDSLLNKKIALEKQKLISLNNVLQAHSPLNILSKGYAIIEDENDKLIKSKDFFSKSLHPPASSSLVPSVPDYLLHLLHKVTFLPKEHRLT